MSQDAYTRAGVSQADADSAVGALVSHLSRIDTGRESRSVDLGAHYASVLRLDERRGLAIGTDGVGTKMVIAERLGRFETIGIDCVAMNVNDLICVGADPIAMLDFILCSSAEPEVCGQIGEGLRAGAEQARVEIPGGEIAQVGDIVSGYELTGTAVGLVDLDQIVDGSAAGPGDAVLGVPSSGLHSNGYTLARAALDGLDLTSEHGLGRPLGEVLLQPTTIYVRAVSELLDAGIGVHGLAHITGDGLNNLLRLRSPVGFEIDRPLDVPPVFDLIRERGDVSEAEMYEVFNMGCGLVCVVAPDDEARAAEILDRHHPGARRIGTVTDEAGRVRRAA
ncbi:phosphoribosylformylglycinamidine cyclo-ligase [Thermoleophilia bacterium SCSIO 60948]|nr:phosphoribosylformylglycinamidine cyclo-ligase [Thermoleophilia bacterium SCSIO 60948]